MFETGKVRANECSSKRQAKMHNRDIFSIGFNMKVCRVFSLESPHRGNSNEYTQYTIFSIKKNSAECFAAPALCLYIRNSMKASV